MKDRVLQLIGKIDEVEEKLGQPDIHSDQKRYRELTQEHSYLSDLKDSWFEYESKCKQLEENRDLASDSEVDPEFLEVIREEIDTLVSKTESLRLKIETLLVPPDPRDNRTIIVELRAGTGGDEAALFVGDCVRMYQIYATRNGWTQELLSCTPSEQGGFKEYVMVLAGKNVFRLMQYEAGTHRVQRVPDTETQGRVHTSAITVAVLLEPEEEDEIDIDEKELKIDTYRASGAGGQHINTTDSAVRITHLPTNTVVYCQEERSQHKNKEKAMRLLRTKIAEEIQRKKQAEVSSLRSLQIGSGDRSERIRTYNYPQNRVSDHRINLTVFKLDQIMAGSLEYVSGPLVSHFYQMKLKG